MNNGSDIDDIFKIEENNGNGEFNEVNIEENNETQNNNETHHVNNNHEEENVSRDEPQSNQSHLLIEEKKTIKEDIVDDFINFNNNQQQEQPIQNTSFIQTQYTENNYDEHQHNHSNDHQQVNNTSIEQNVTIDLNDEHNEKNDIISSTNNTSSEINNDNKSNDNVNGEVIFRKIEFICTRKCIDVNEEPFVAYVVNIETDNSTFTNKHMRYSSILKLHEHYKLTYVEEAKFLPEFPAKLVVSSQEDYNKRIQLWNDYFSYVLKHKDMMKDKKLFETFELVPDSKLMKCYAYEKFGTVDECLQLIDDRLIPSIGDNDVMIQVHAASVNPVDLRFLEGMYQGFFSFAFPFIPGFDVSGVIVYKGKNVTRFSLGDEVFAMADRRYCGGFAQYVKMDHNKVAKKPSNYNFVESACFPLAALTSYQSLVTKANIQKDQKVLILGGSGGTGSYAIQIAKAKGCYVAVTCSSRNVEYCKNLGADKIINYENSNWWEVLKGENYDVIHQCYYNENDYNNASLVLKKKGSIFVSIVIKNEKFTVGKMASEAGKILSRKFKGLLGISYASVICECNYQDLEKVKEMIERGEIKPCCNHIYSFAETPEAFKFSDTGKAVGKIVVIVRNEEK